MIGINPMALRKAKNVYNFGLSECNFGLSGCNRVVYNFGLSECKRVNCIQFWPFLVQ